MPKKKQIEEKSSTWFIDIDGTIIRHNSHLSNNQKLILGVKKFWKQYIKKKDIIILTTARDIAYKKKTEDFLKKNKIKYNLILYNLNSGKRYLINDKKNRFNKAISINVNRDQGFKNLNKLL